MYKRILMDVYTELYDFYGPQKWWPADTPLEVVVGAILTQNTAWRNVKRAIQALKESEMLELDRILEAQNDVLAELIKPSGYYNIKAKRLKEVLRFFKHLGGFKRALSMDTRSLREQLLNVHGVGEETADSILLYALERPVFVVDAYTRRILARLGILKGEETYEEIQKIFEKELELNTDLFNEFHALLVKHGKEHCTKKNPICWNCPLKPGCSFALRSLNLISSQDLKHGRTTK